MSNFCCSSPTPNESTNDDVKFCPKDKTKGDTVQLITLKSLLIPTALGKLNSETNYRFCQSSDCPVVYFSEEKQVFTTDDVKVPILQKNSKETTPVCYCFGWTRQKLRQEIEEFGESNAVAAIMAHVRAQRCGCEVNNPQGRCCLGNVKSTLKTLAANDRSL
jgi:hypothetical protein